MVYIYVIALQKGKYYIGKTDNPQIRLSNHFNNNGLEWTKIYKPINIIEIIPNCDSYDEDKYVLKYMYKYGIQNVRGGSFLSINLNNSTIEHINKMILGSNNSCFICGNTNHFANECDNFVYACNYWDKEFEYEKDCEKHEIICYRNKKYSQNIYNKNTNLCFRCGRTSHYADECYASVNGYYIK